jgi:hypothetical protein
MITTAADTLPANGALVVGAQALLHALFMHEVVAPQLHSLFI